jgi:hypothetical protein
MRKRGNLQLGASLFLATALVHAQRAPGVVDEWLARLDTQGAERVIRDAGKSGPRIMVQIARIAVHRGQPKVALRLLDAAGAEAASEDGRELRAIAFGLLHATEGAVERTTDDGALRVQFQHGGDVALLPWLADTVVAARRVTGESLGYTWSAPTYVVLVRDQQTLAEATGLPYESARTTGTLAIAKWGRVTMLSPRATEGGFPWRDTIVHELAHLALTAVTSDHAPLWLQEGVAKDMETHWREREPFDEQPPPEALVLEADAKGELLPLDKLGPSVAMLPSARSAAIAFASATSFVRYLRSDLGPQRWPAYLRALAGSRSSDVLLEATGKSFGTWQAAWLASVRREGKAMANATPSVPEIDRDVPRRMRIGRLLVERGHGEAAMKELARVGDVARRSVEREGGWFTLHALAHDQRHDDVALDALLFGAAPATDPRGAWYRLRARRDEGRGDGSAGAKDREKAVSREPYGPEAVCEDGRTGREAALCDAARQRMQPGVE